MSDKSEYVVYTDGSFRLPSYGAWGYGIVDNNKKQLNPVVSGVDFKTTNNRMELQAILKCLQSFTEPSKITIYTDSQYSMNCAGKWIYSWRRNGWKTLDGSDVKNRDLIEPMYDLLRKHTVTIYWVRGHSGQNYNEQVDRVVQGLTKEMVEGKIHPGG